MFAIGNTIKRNGLRAVPVSLNNHSNPYLFHVTSTKINGDVLIPQGEQYEKPVVYSSSKPSFQYAFPNTPQRSAQKKLRNSEFYYQLLFQPSNLIPDRIKRDWGGMLMIKLGKMIQPQKSYIYVCPGDGFLQAKHQWNYGNILDPQTDGKLIYTEFISSTPVPVIDCIEIDTGECFIDTIPLEDFIIINDDSGNERFGTLPYQDYINRLPDGYELLREKILAITHKVSDIRIPDGLQKYIH